MIAAIHTHPKLPLLSTFTDNDRRECLQTINTIVHLANRVRCEGYLALEELTKKLPERDFFLKMGLMLVVDNLPATDVSIILQNYILSTFNPGAENSGLLRRMVQMEGVVHIQAGENPRIIEAGLHAMLGERFYHSEAQKYSKDAGKPDTELLDEQYSHVSDFISGEGNPWLNEMLLTMPSRDLQLVICETDQRILINAMCGLPTNVQKRIFENMSGALVNTVKFNMYVYPGAGSYISDALEELSVIIKRLQGVEN